MSDVVDRFYTSLPMPEYFEADEVQLVAQRAGIRSAQAVLAIWAMLDYLMARLPSPLVGRIREQLRIAKGVRPADGSNGGVK